MKTVVKVASILSYYVLFGKNQPNLAGRMNREQERRGQSWTDTSSQSISHKEINQTHPMPRKNLPGSSTQLFAVQPHKPGCAMILIFACL